MNKDIDAWLQSEMPEVFARIPEHLAFYNHPYSGEFRAVVCKKCHKAAYISPDAPRNSGKKKVVWVPLERMLQDFGGIIRYVQHHQCDECLFVEETISC